jgi:hypothetical protein
MIKAAIAIILIIAFSSIFCEADLFTNTVVNGDVPIVTTAESSFDGPMIGGINATSLEWWYFDAVSENGEQQITVVFYRSQYFSGLPEINFVEVVMVWPNGTTGRYEFGANSSSVTTTGYGASGVWNGTGLAFTGTSTLSEYTITFNNDIFLGGLAINSIAPAQYANGLPPGNPNASPLAFPSIYWTNAIPAGVANCKLTVLGDVFTFQNGVGYHDHNWGGEGIPAGISWYWGHATVGPYSYVYSDGEIVGGEQFGTAYLVDNGIIEVATRYTPFATENNLAVVIPFGNGTEFPPSDSSNLPSAFLVEFISSSGELWSFVEESVHIAENQYGPLTYTRWIGKVCGGQVGGPSVCGAGVWEWFRFLL